jgi:hypothetical protein
MSAPAPPPCGLYRTLTAIADVPAGRLVYFHNHGDPGAGVYLPERWAHNRATFSSRGHTLPASVNPHTALAPLPREGLYRVGSQFHCCAKRCVEFAPETLVQLGYEGAGRAILFIAEMAGGAVSLPSKGTVIDDEVFPRLIPLIVRQREADTRDDLGTFPRGVIVH